MQPFVKMKAKRVLEVVGEVNESGKNGGDLKLKRYLIHFSVDSTTNSTTIGKSVWKMSCNTPYLSH